MHVKQKVLERKIIYSKYPIVSSYSRKKFCLPITYGFFFHEMSDKMLYNMLIVVFLIVSSLHYIIIHLKFLNFKLLNKKKSCPLKNRP